MEEKLKSISKGIRWSLLLKSLISFGVWLYLPEYIGLVILFYFYFSSFFRAKYMSFPFFSILILSHLAGPNIWGALFLAVSIYLILGIKEFSFIDRRAAYSALIFSALFMAGILIYANLDAWSMWLPIKMALFAALFWGLMRGFMLKIEQDEEIKKYPLPLAIISFLFWQVAVVISFLPLDFIYRAALAIFSSFILFEWLRSFVENKLDKNKVLLYLSFLFILAIFIFTFAKWSL